MEKLSMHSPDLTQQNIDRIGELFPSCVTETLGDDGRTVRAVNFDLLRQELSPSIVDGPQERYHLDWPGKRQALLTANAPIAKTLRPARNESVDFDTTGNLFIEGDNLDALKILQETYLGKIKMIYIDPPYNTGNDFIYEDDFAEDSQDFLRRSNQQDEDGNRLVANPESNGRFHSDWLSMMYSRLKLARNLLHDEGIIVISIDDGEQENLKKLCDEVFGPDNFINTVSVNMKNIAGASGGGEDKRLKKNLEYLHLYSRNYRDLESFNNVHEFIPIHELTQRYLEQGKSWKYTSVLVEEGEKEYIASAIDGDGNDIRIFRRKDYDIRSISRIMKEEDLSEADVYAKYATKIFQTAMPQSSIRPRVMTRLKELGITGELFSIDYVPKSGRNKGVVYEQFYKGDNFRLFAWLRDVAVEIEGVLYKKELQGTYWDFAGETKNLTKEGDVPFPNGKKPVALLQRLLEMQQDKDLIILDFFAGSGTTGHAVMKINAEDGGNRKFVLVQLPEAIESSEFESIAHLTRTRLSRAGRNLLASRPANAEDLDVGFRAFKVDSSNMSEVFYTPDELKQDELALVTDSVKPGRTDEDLLFQVILDWGSAELLTGQIVLERIHDKSVFFVEGNSLVACFESTITEKLVTELAGRQPLRVVFRDSGFDSDAVRINTEQIFRQLSPATEVKTV